MNFQRAVYIVTVLLIGMLRDHADAEPWSERIGFPPGQKVIIIDAHEIGVSWEMNEAAKHSLEAGELSSVGIVTTGPWFEEFAAWSRNHPKHDYGVSVALTNPYSSIQWNLRTAQQGLSTLVDADGKPWRTVIQLSVNATADDVKRELDAQIKAAREAGVKLSHISGYHGTVFCRHDLAAVFLGSAKKYWLPAPVVELTPELIDRFTRMGFPIDETMIELIANYPLPKLDDLTYLPYGETFDRKKANFEKQLRSLKPGLTQIVCGPAVESRGLQLLSDDWQQSVWDAQVLADEQIKQVMKEEGVIMTNWPEIMTRFEQGANIERGAGIEQGAE